MPASRRAASFVVSTRLRRIFKPAIGFGTVTGPNKRRRRRRRRRSRWRGAGGPRLRARRCSAGPHGGTESVRGELARREGRARGTKSEGARGERGREGIWGPRRPWAGSLRAAQGRLDVPAGAATKEAAYFFPPPPPASLTLSRSLASPLVAVSRRPAAA